MLSTVCLMFTGRPWGQFLDAFTQEMEYVAPQGLSASFWGLGWMQGHSWDAEEGWYP